MVRSVVIVGGSLAGLRAAETLRTEGFDGDVTVIGAEAHLPYDRPPLSKKVLAGEWGPERIALRRENEYPELGLEFRLGSHAEALDLGARQVRLRGGETVAFDGLVIATGATPRRLPRQPELDGIVTLRTLDDALDLRDRFDRGPRRVVVVGAGFIGAEVAATARGRGLEVTILEALPVPLERALGPVMGQVVAQIHGDHGVEVRCGAGVEGFVGSSRVEAVRLADGSRLDADVVVVGVGVTPATGWLDASGLELRDGVVCDTTLATGAPLVFAAGDVARWPNALFDEEMRVEHWTNAAEQGAHAARNLLEASAGGRGQPYAPVPFFWSHQYDTLLQFVGRGSGHDEVAVVHGAVQDRRFVALYRRGGRLLGALGVSLPKLLMPYRRLLAEGASWDDALAHAATAGR